MIGSAEIDTLVERDGAAERLVEGRVARRDAFMLPRASPWQSAQAFAALPVFFAQSCSPSSTNSMAGLEVSSSCIARVSGPMNE